MKFKRIAALLLLVCLLALTGCAGRTQTAILCVKKGVVAAQALCESDQTLSYALAEDDAAALQQLESGQCNFALVTVQGWQQAKDAGYDAAERLNDVTLAQFAILSRAGGTAQWGRNTRVVIVGAAEADGDVLARQVLTCALYGTVRNTDWESALSSLRGKRADVVMGLAVPGQKNVEKAFKKVKKLELLSMPESLVSIQLPDDSMEKAKVVFGGQNAESYALYGVLVCAKDADEDERSRVLQAAQEAGLVDSTAVILN